MTTLLLLCTSDKVDTKAVQELNDAYRAPEIKRFGSSGFFNKLNPAHSDVSAILRPSKEPVETYDIEIFGYQSDEQIQKSYETIMKHVADKNINYVQPRTFAVLDERGVQDHTLVFYNHGINWDDELDEKRYWRHWRVAWSEAYDTHVPFEFATEIVQNVYMHSDDFLDSHGVFQVRKAMKHYRYLQDD